MTDLAGPKVDIAAYLTTEADVLTPYCLGEADEPKIDACLPAKMREAAAEITRLRGLVEEARGVLEPFAVAGRTLSSRWQDHETHWQRSLSFPLSVGSLRLASSLLPRLK